LTRTDPGAFRADVARRLDGVVAAMEAAGIGPAACPPLDGPPPAAAFGGDRLTLEQWLNFVFVPNVRRVLAEELPMPAGSQVAVRAAREWSGDPGREPVIDALVAFDREFDR
jgi:uncharacterized protein YqcC (DUF446 family)